MKEQTYHSTYVVHDRVTIRTPEKTLAQQSMKDECDINQILAKGQETGLIRHVRDNPGRYLDLPGEMDFQAALNLVHSAEQLFLSLPSSLRTRFQNNPAEYLAFCENPENEAEMRELGLLDPLPATPEGPEPDAGPAPVAPLNADPDPV